MLDKWREKLSCIGRYREVNHHGTNLTLPTCDPRINDRKRHTWRLRVTSCAADSGGHHRVRNAYKIDCIAEDGASWKAFISDYGLLELRD